MALIGASCLSSTVGRGADALPEIIQDQPCEIHQASTIGLAIADDGGLCSFKRGGETKPLRFKIVPGLANTNLVSFESLDRPGFYLRHFFFRLKLDQKPARPDPVFNGDTTFEVRPARNADAVRLRSFNYRECFVAVTHTSKAYIVPDPSPDAMELTIVY